MNPRKRAFKVWSKVTRVQKSHRMDAVSETCRKTRIHLHLKCGKILHSKVFRLQTGNTHAWVQCLFQLLCHGNQRTCSIFPPRLLSNDIDFESLKPFFLYIFLILYLHCLLNTHFSPSSAAVLYSLLSVHSCSPFILQQSLLPWRLCMYTITFFSLSLLFLPVSNADSLCHKLQDTLVLYFAKSTGAPIQLNYLIFECG